MLSNRAATIASDLIKIKSITFDELDAAKYISQFLIRLGFTVQIDERNNVIGELKGHGGGSRIFFLGHHDTVEEGNHSLWTYPPFDAQLYNGELYGRGAVDDKGGVAACLSAIEQLLKDHPDGLAGDILLVSSREETSDLSTRGILKVLERGINADFCIVLEPTSLEIILGHKGRMVIEITTLGKTAHGSVPEQGINSIHHMAHVLTALEKMPLPYRPPLGQGTQCVGVINGGVRPNIVAEKCTISIDRRIVSGETPDTVYAEISTLLNDVKKIIPELNTNINIKPPMNPSYVEENSNVVEITKKVLEEMGLPIKVGYMNGHTDGEWVINDAKIPAIVLGPGDMNLAHASDEKISIAELGQAANLYYKIMEKCLLKEE